MLHYQEYSVEKDEAIVFLHGFLGAASLWEEMISLLSLQYHCIALDLPGHGKSECMGEVHTMEAMASEVKKLLDEKEISKCHLIGHSMGGYVALAFLEANPSYCASLCLLNSTSQADSAERKLLREKSIRLALANPTAYIQATLSSLFPPNYTNEKALDTALSVGLQTPVKGIVASIKGMMRRKNRTHLLPTFKKLLFIYSETDPILDLTSLQKVLEELSPRKILKIEGAHMGLLEQPLELAKQYQAWLLSL